MEFINIQILNPKAKKLLNDLADLNLIKIKSKTEVNSEFKQLLTSLRSKSKRPPLDEITKEVKSVRAKRNG